MKIRKFQAANVREAIAQVRQELGADAMIVATRQIRRGLLGTGVEVTAAVDDDQEAPPMLTSPSGPQPTSEGNWLSEHDVERIMAPLRSELRSIRSILRPLADDRNEEAMRADLSSLREQVEALRSSMPEKSEPVGPQLTLLRDQVEALRSSMPEKSEPVGPQLTLLRDQVEALRSSMPEKGEPVGPQLTLLRDQVEGLRSSMPEKGEPLGLALSAMRETMAAIHTKLTEPGPPIGEEFASIRDSLTSIQKTIPATTSDPIRAEIAGLRDAMSFLRAALPDSSNEPIRAELAALRDELSTIQTTLPETTGKPIRAEMVALREAMTAIQTTLPVTTGEPIRAEMAALREAMSAIHMPSFEGLSASLGESLGESLHVELQALRDTVSSMHVSPPEPPPRAPSIAQLAASSVLTVPSMHRIIALVGPTGVGKTTTIAKLAARAALIDQKSVAIITLDTYRVGGEDQIRAYADLIGVPLVLVSDPARLRHAILQLEDKDRIYIDTAGRSPRDAEAIAELENAFAGIDDLEIHLVVAASSQPAVIDSCLRRYQDVGVDRLLFTKLDEADDLSELVRAPSRLGLPISFVTTGQRVPEDIEEATQESLVHFASVGHGEEEGQVAA